MMINRRMLMLLPLVMWTGVSVAFYSGVLTIIVSNSINEADNLKQYYSQLAMIAFGVGEILGCFFIGYIIDKIGSKKASWVNVGICIVMTACTLIFVI